MDRDWVREQLQQFGQLCQHYERTIPPGEWAGDEDLRLRMWRAQPTIRRIFETLDPELAGGFELGSLAGEAHAQTLVARAMGILDDADEWAVRLRPEAPTLPADEFHRWVWDAARTFWESRHYRAAVDAAATAINAHTQTKIRRTDISDDDLMNQAFTEKPKTGQPYLRLPGDDTKDTTLKSRNNALRPFAAGCFAGIRNPATHEHGLDWSQQKALENLAALSILARWIDECEVRYGP
jgi:Protein of unknown function (Hypoth_ymh)